MQAQTLLVRLLTSLVVSTVLAPPPAIAADRATDYTVRFVPLESPAGPGSLAPRLARTPAGAVLLSWLEPAAAGGHDLKFATLDGDRWSPARRVAGGADWYVNWADFPSVTPVTSRDFVAHWLVKHPGSSYAYDIALAISRDGGRTWGKPFSPHDDGTATEHGFVSVFPWPDPTGAGPGPGGFGVLWLDGRQTGGGGAGGEGSGGPMTTRWARYAPEGRLLAGGELDGRVCDCCGTDVALATTGPVAAYRDRTPDEIRDIAVARHAAGQWQPPLTIGNDRWQIAGCPVNGPAIAARGDRVAVAWYTGAGGARRVQLSWSTDAGRTFGPPVLVDDAAVTGYVDLALAGDGRAVVSWTGRTPAGTGQLRLRRVPFAGAPGRVQVVAEGDMGRGAGFPQLVLAPDRVVHAWTRPGEPSRVLTAWSLADGG